MSNSIRLVGCFEFKKFSALLGLRLLVYINTTDYLPTTQATGVRIAIHGKEE
jgi:hypothetical protein